jgi:curved DNA-binding protein
MSKRDYYEVLGVSRSASQDEIRKSFKKLARKHHPDVKPDDPQAQKAFAEITEAYEVLGDEDKRKKYDQFGHSFRGAESAGNPFQGAGASFDLEEILGGMFGGGGRGPFQGGGRRSAPRSRKGQDARADITIPFQVAVEGGTHDLSVQTDAGIQKLSVRIPVGIEDGQTIRLAGQGHPGTNSGAAGDLLVTIHVAAHPWFRRDGRNLMIDVPVTATEAALGGKIEVPTLTEGSVVMTVPPGTSSGARLRLKAKGVRDAKSGERGDQMVTLKIVVPKVISDDARRLFEQLAVACPETPREKLWK